MTTGLKELFLWRCCIVGKVGSIPCLFFEGGACSLGGAKLQADEQSEKVRWLWAGSVFNIEVLGGCSVKRLPFVLQVLCGPSLNGMSV